MLEDSLVVSRPSARLKKPFTVVVSAVTHGAIVGALILLPLFQADVLPQIPVSEPLRPPVGLGRGVSLIAAPRNGGSPRSLNPVTPKHEIQPPPPSERLIAPTAIPYRVVQDLDESAATDGPIAVLGGTGNGRGTGIFGDGTGEPGGGVPFGQLGGFGDGKPPTPPPAPVRPEPTPTRPPAPVAPVRRGGDLALANLVHQVAPAYPPLARKINLAGIVILEAVITREGKIDPARLRVISGHVLLRDSAVDAVKEWKYRPTILNGEAVEIVTTITVNYSLN